MQSNIIDPRQGRRMASVSRIEDVGHMVYIIWFHPNGLFSYLRDNRHHFSGLRLALRRFTPSFASLSATVTRNYDGLFKANISARSIDARRNGRWRVAIFA